MGCSLLDGFLMSACQGGLISNDGCAQIPKLALITAMILERQEESYLGRSILGNFLWYMHVVMMI